MLWEDSSHLSQPIGALPPTKAVFRKIQQIDISMVTSKKYFESYNLTKNARESFFGKI